MKRYATLLLLLMLFMPTAVYADVAPPPPPQGANIAPNTEITQVQMVSENVLVAIAQNTGTAAPTAKVKAQFQMRNLGGQSETMEVRFPLNVIWNTMTVDEKSCPYPDFFPVISDFTASVDGKAAVVTRTKVFVDNSYQGNPGKKVDCWANFTVTFPPGKDVQIEVGYSVTGYRKWNIDGLYAFPYVLMTGAGWNGTIETADVTIRAPMKLTEETLFEYEPDYLPEAFSVEGNEAHFHFEDFEPDSNASITIVNPALWQKALTEQANLEKHPEDGESWGRLGKAYKEMILLERGYRWDVGGEKLYQKAKDAYQKCVELLPKDADWHAGYAELLWWNALSSSYGSKLQHRDELVQAAEQIQMALAINPRQEKARLLLEDMGFWTLYRSNVDPLVAMEGSKPVFLLLTTTPTAAPEDIVVPTMTPTAEATEALPTATTQPTRTTAPTIRVTATSQPTLEPSQTPAAIAQVTEAAPEKQEPSDGKQPGGSFCMSAFLPIGFLAAVFAIRGKR